MEPVQKSFCLKIYHEQKARTDSCTEFCVLRVATGSAATLERPSLYSRHSDVVLSVSSLWLPVVVEGKSSSHIRPSANGHRDNLYSRRRSRRSLGCPQ